MIKDIDPERMEKLISAEYLWAIIFSTLIPMPL